MKESDLIVGNTYNILNGQNYKMVLKKKTKSKLEFLVADKNSDFTMTIPYTGKNETNLNFITPAE